MQHLQTAWEQLNPQDAHLCYRLPVSHQSDVQADVYGEVIWVYWYRPQAPTTSELEKLFTWGQKLHKKVCVRHMLNRGTGVGGKEKQSLFCSQDTTEEWIASENKLQFLLKKNSGFSPGLFLDQYENRKWVLENSKNKRVLNLFSYTSGFSVAAAAGEAVEVTTVDVSSSFLEWSKKNFELNQLDPLKYEFFAQDVPLFMSGAVKRNRQWDLIICDPPSFGRSKNSVWKIEKDLSGLAGQLWSCLSSNGTILFTCNYEQWSQDEVVKNFTFKIKKGSYRITQLPSKDHFLKGFLISKLI